MKCAILCVSILALTSCASAVMERYVGKLMSEAVMDHGMPSSAFDVEPGKRAFVWSRSMYYSFGGGSTTTGSVIGGNLFASTYVSPAMTTQQTCQYVAFADRIRTDIEGPAAWHITGFRKPSLLCE